MNNSHLIPVPPELFYKFDKLKFHDDIHKYYLGEKNLISVTTVLHMYEEEFDSQYWSEVKSIELKMTQQEVLDMWEAGNEKSKIKGSIIHNYAELLYNNKVYKYSQDIVDNYLGEKHIATLKKHNNFTIKEEFDIVKQYVDNFYNDSFNKLIPIKTEYVVYDEEWALAGMMDILFWNVKKQCFQIWDYKTNKELSKSSKYSKRLKFPFHALDECEYNIYCLQLSTYKSILERNINIKIDGMYLIWLNETNPNYQIIECQDLSPKIAQLFK